MRNFDTIILHASATPPNWMAGRGVHAKRDEIDRWHRARGFNSIGYHFVVDRDGATTTGRHINTTGAHVKGHNTGSVGVCIIGGKWPDGRWGVATDDFSDHFTPEQDRAVRDLITDLCERYPAIKHIKGHNDYTNAKGCPCFKVSEWLKGGGTQPQEVYPARSVYKADIPAAQPEPPHPDPVTSLISRILKFLRGNA